MAAVGAGNVSRPGSESLNASAREDWLMTFEELFRSTDTARDNYLSRLFGMFSEDIVRFWSAHEEAPYRYLGRPTLWADGQFATLDFALQSRSDQRIYVAEQKAELAFEGYRYLRLTDAQQVAHHAHMRAFAWLLDAARDPGARVAKVAAKPISVAGAILVWGAVTAGGCAAVKATYGFADVLSLEDMLADLRTWGDEAWRARLATLESWSNDLFRALL